MPIIKGATSKSLDRISISTDYGLSSISDSDKILFQLLQRNINHFNQASETLFVQPPLSDIYNLFHLNLNSTKKIFSWTIEDAEYQSQIITNILSSF